MSINPIFSLIDQDAAHQLQRALVQGSSVTVTDEMGQTPLQCAAYYGQIGCVRVLLQAGVPVDQISSKKMDSPLIRAAINGHVAVARLLLDNKADPNFVGTYKETPLYKAVLMCPKTHVTDMAELLIDNGARILPEILKHVFITAQIELATLFLDRGADPKYKTEDGQTLYTLALHTKSLFFLRLLQQRGVDMYAGRDLPLHAATVEGSSKVRQVLRQGGIEIDKKDLCGTTALLAATFGGKIDCAEAILEAGANPNIANRHNLTPLTAAILRDQLEFAQKLIAAGADINRGDQNGAWNALWMAALRGHVTLFEELLRMGANYTTRDTEGFSLLAMLKCNRPPHKQKLCKLVKDKDSTARDYAKKFIELKHFGHFIDTSTTIPNIPFPAYGGKSELFAKTFAKAVRAFSRQTDILSEKTARELVQTLHFASDQRSHTPTQTLFRIQQGMFTMILTGWATHGTTCAFLQDRIFIANTGSSGKVAPEVVRLIGDPGIERLQIRHYNQELLDTESLQQVRAGSSDVGSEREAYAYLMYNYLPKKLQFHQTEEDKALASSCNIQTQDGPICTKASIEAMVKCYLALKKELEAFAPLMSFSQDFVLNAFKATK